MVIWWEKKPQQRKKRKEKIFIPKVDPPIEGYRQAVDTIQAAAAARIYTKLPVWLKNKIAIQGLIL